MADVNESLPELIERRMVQLGFTSKKAMYDAAKLPRGSITYETLRRVAKGEQRSSRDGGTTIRDLAAILKVSEEEIRSAEAGYTPVGGWAKYERLTEAERSAVESVMDAILAAREQGGSNDASAAEAEKRHEQAPVLPNLNADDYTPAARRGRKRGAELRDELDKFDGESQDG